MILDRINLKSGDWKASILPDFGGNLASLSFRGENLLRLPKKEEERSETPFLYGSPLLLPPNRTRDGIFCFRGVQYELPVNEKEKNNHLHGLFYNAPFSIISETKERCILCHQNRGNRYPFRFTILLTYLLSGEGLKLEAKVQNDDDRAMPVVLGFHTTFVEPSICAVPIERRWERDERFLPTGRMLPLDTFEEKLKTGCRIGKKKLAGYYTCVGHQVKVGSFLMTTSDAFNQFVLFNGGGNQGYVCIEPQTGPVNGLNYADGYQIIESGQTEKYWIHFSLESGLE